MFEILKSDSEEASVQQLHPEISQKHLPRYCKICPIMILFPFVRRCDRIMIVYKYWYQIKDLNWYHSGTVQLEINSGVHGKHDAKKNKKTLDSKVVVFCNWRGEDTCGIYSVAYEPTVFVSGTFCEILHKKPFPNEIGNSSFYFLSQLGWPDCML